MSAFNWIDEVKRAVEGFTQFTFRSALVEWGHLRVDFDTNKLETRSVAIPVVTPNRLPNKNVINALIYKLEEIANE